MLGTRTLKNKCAYKAGAKPMATIPPITKSTYHRVLVDLPKPSSGLPVNIFGDDRQMDMADMRAATIGIGRAVDHFSRFGYGAGFAFV